MKQLTISLCLAVTMFVPAGLARAAEDTTLKVYWKDGIRMDTADKQFRFKLGGRIMNDWVFFDLPNALSDAVGDPRDGTEFRRARLYLAGEIYENIIFKAQYDFAGQDADFKDVYIGMKNVPALDKVRVGHFKEPFSLEEQTSSKYITFMERALPIEAFSPGRNTGLGFNASVADQRATVSAGVFRQTDDSGDSPATDDDGTNITARVTGTPLHDENGLIHVGVSVNHRRLKDAARFRSRPGVHDSPRFVDTGTFGADDATIYGFEGAAVFGPASLQGEYLLADVSAQGGGSDPLLTGYYIYASYFLTGESRAYKASDGAFSRVKPNSNFMLGKGGSGALELALRWAGLDLNDGAASGGDLTNLTVGLNWYLNPNVRVMANYVFVDLDSVDDGHIFGTRFQIDF